MGTSISASSGFLYLDGDADNSATSDAINTVGFTDGVTLSAKTYLTLEATGTPEKGVKGQAGYAAAVSSQIIASGSLTLNAGKGVSILDDMVLLARATRVVPTPSNGYKTGNGLVINADVDQVPSSNGTIPTRYGVLTIAAHKVVSN